MSREELISYIMASVVDDLAKLDDAALAEVAEDIKQVQQRGLTSDE